MKHLGHAGMMLLTGLILFPVLNLLIGAPALTLTDTGAILHVSIGVWCGSAMAAVR